MMRQPAAVALLCNCIRSIEEGLRFTASAGSDVLRHDLAAVRAGPGRTVIGDILAVIDDLLSAAECLIFLCLLAEEMLLLGSLRSRRGRRRCIIKAHRSCRRSIVKAHRSCRRSVIKTHRSRRRSVVEIEVKGIIFLFLGLIGHRSCRRNCLSGSFGFS